MLESSAALSSELNLKSSPSQRSSDMEKNPNTARSSSAGPTAAESKAKTDTKNNGGSRRRNRKREPSYPKADSFPGPRRTPPQKSKSFDKRPAQRGGGVRQGGLMGGGRREEVAETRRAEFSPAQFSGPKKISLNHLLNFTFEPRGGHSGSGGDGHSCWGRRNKWGHKHKPFNKELFLQANCQFVVIDDQDYKAHFSDPDTLVNWDYVQQVRIYSHEVPSCPICLYPPVAAHITRCGHIYCWPCMLHYLSLSEKSWSKCPICYEAVDSADLKSVVAMETRQYVPGDLITMRLMRREKGVLVALPSSQWVKVKEPIRFGDVHLSAYSKLLLASREQVLTLLAEERAALQVQLNQEKDDPHSCFIQSALLQLQERKDALMKRHRQNRGSVEGADMRKLSISDSTSTGMGINNFTSSKPILQYAPLVDDEVQGAHAELPERKPQRPGDETPSSVQSEAGPIQNSENGPYYYFYQAEDGQQMFLHPVNVRCLHREYGSLENGPESITAAVVEIKGHTVSEDDRRRHQYLSHLPLTCEFSICELNLQPPILSKETLDSFSDELEKRKHVRQSKLREEKRRERRIEMEENGKQGKCESSHETYCSAFSPRVFTPKSNEFLGVQIGLENLQQFPAFGYRPLHRPPVEPPEFLQGTRSPLSSSPASDGLMFPSLNGQSPALGVGSAEDSHCLSFAQMLKDGKARGDVGPKPAPKKDVFLAPPVAESDGESDESDRVPVPNFQNSFSQAFEAALLQLDHGPPAEAPATSEGKRGKKKKKQKLLFSTSMVHTK